MDNKTFTEENFHQNCEMIMKYIKQFDAYVERFVNQQHEKSYINYEDTYRKLLTYENQISSLNAELELLKKENTLLHDKLEMNQVNLSDIKEIVQLKKTHKN